MITTMVRNKTHTGPNPTRKVIDMYADYWKANFEESYEAVTDTSKGGEALVVTDGPKSRTTWKKFKGNCRYCNKIFLVDLYLFFTSC
jgi:hypothetical protein